MKKVIGYIIFLYLCLVNYAASVETLKLMSKSMAREINNFVIIPKLYSVTGKAFPVLYLLHGATGDYTDWVTMVPEIKDYADKFNMIIVCPDGGYTSWYFDSPIDRSMKYETYISNELVNNVDVKYNTIKDKAGRAISGLSMGGHGAFYLSFRHQDIWGAAGSMSGGVDIRPFPNNWDIAKRLGSFSQNPDNWEKNTVTNMLYLLDGKSLKLIFDCGTDDFFYVVNKNLHSKMLERNIPHDYIERPGDHSWDYWKNAIKYQLVFFYGFFTNK